MTNELFPFQQNAVGALRQKASDAHRAYEMTRTPQVVSLQTPTGTIDHHDFAKQDRVFGGQGAHQG